MSNIQYYSEVFTNGAFFFTALLVGLLLIEWLLPKFSNKDNWFTRLFGKDDMTEGNHYDNDYHD